MIPITESIKTLMELGKGIASMEWRQTALDLQQQAGELIGRNMELEQRVRDLEQKLEFKDKVSFHPPFYFAEHDPVPYCPHCWEADRLAIHVTGPIATGTGPVYHCFHCDKRWYPDKETGERLARIETAG